MITPGSGIMSAGGIRSGGAARSNVVAPGRLSVPLHPASASKQKQRIRIAPRYVGPAPGSTALRADGLAGAGIAAQGDGGAGEGVGVDGDLELDAGDGDVAAAADRVEELLRHAAGDELAGAE